MSIEAVAEFTNKLAEDESLQQELKSAIGDKESLDAAQAVSELGAKHGYEFTAEEAITLRQLVLANETGELNDEQLEAVAGGVILDRIGGWLGGKVGGKTGSKVGSALGGIAESFLGGW